MTAQTTTTLVGVEEFLAGDWPPDSWLIDGEVVMNDPGFHHQEVVARILRAVMDWCDNGADRGRAGFGGNWVMGTHSLLRPDVWWAATIPTGTRSALPPNLAVEVRSPSTWRFDVGRKREIYEERGVTELWLVDTPAQSILVWRRAEAGGRLEAHTELGPGDYLTTALLDGFTLSVDQLFAGSG